MNSAILKMKKFLSALLFLLAFNHYCNAQENDSIKFYEIVDTPAEPIGGREAIYNWIGANMNFELIKSADSIDCDYNIKNKVFISYIVDEQGNLFQPEVLRGLGEPYDSEALRLISEMPIKWTVALKDGQKVKMRNTTVIKFCSGKNNKANKNEVKNKKKSKWFNRRKN